MHNPKVWFITGASRGLGLDITKAVLAAGDQVVATVRSKPEDLVAQLNSQDLHVLVLDVTQESQAHKAIQEAIAIFGQLDVLVNNAGFGLLSAVEEATDQAIRHMFDTNVFGTLNVIRAALPYFRQQRRGHIINLSSVGGLVGSPGWGLYASTKFAVEGFSEALAKELAPLHIHVTVIEPGYFRTDFLDSSSLNTSATVIEDYAATVGKMRARACEVNKQQPGDPRKLAAALVRIAHSDNPPLHLPLGKDALESYQAKTVLFQNDIDAWHEVIVGTDYDQVH
ncbi:oxidoreductase [Spirosoma soli]|uniref:Oxidoreductase n=1 Tax=Spirosoma soli TaxID=1770529 RepID=A0ABW5M5G1_9BACT